MIDSLDNIVVHRLSNHTSNVFGWSRGRCTSLTEHHVCLSLTTIPPHPTTPPCCAPNYPVGDDSSSGEDWEFTLLPARVAWVGMAAGKVLNSGRFTTQEGELRKAIMPAGGHLSPKRVADRARRLADKARKPASTQFDPFDDLDLASGSGTNAAGARGTAPRPPLSSAANAWHVFGTARRCRTGRFNVQWLGWSASLDKWANQQGRGWASAVVPRPFG